MARRFGGDLHSSDALADLTVPDQVVNNWIADIIYLKLCIDMLNLKANNLFRVNEIRPCIFTRKTSNGCRYPDAAS